MLAWTVGANPVKTCCPTDRNATAVHTSVLFPVLKLNCCCPVWGCIYTSFCIYQGYRNITENKCSRQNINIITSSLVMQRRNIHSLLTLAAEPSEPSAGAAVRPRGWPVSQDGGASRPNKNRILGPQWKSAAEVCSHCTFRKERAAGVVPAFTMLQKKSQVHFARASNTTFRSHQDQM